MGVFECVPKLCGVCGVGGRALMQVLLLYRLGVASRASAWTSAPGTWRQECGSNRWACPGSGGDL